MYPSTPQSAKFLHTVCQRFCQISEPCFHPCFSSLQRTMARGWRGWWGVGGSNVQRVESMFNQELTPIGPHPNFILFNPLHKKSIHAAGDHHWSRQNIRLVRTVPIRRFRILRWFRDLLSQYRQGYQASLSWTFFAVLRIRIRDRVLFDPWIRDPGSGILVKMFIQIFWFYVQ